MPHFDRLVATAGDQLDGPIFLGFWIVRTFTRGGYECHTVYIPVMRRVDHVRHRDVQEALGGRDGHACDAAAGRCIRESGCGGPGSVVGVYICWSVLVLWVTVEEFMGFSGSGCSGG